MTNTPTIPQTLPADEGDPAGLRFMRWYPHSGERTYHELPGVPAVCHCVQYRRVDYITLPRQPHYWERY
ncbi:unnamed protein product [marine sediment metagenome]|uniref:Uncharacterized protein n=1 Tax=marine sediment metagenome TaxID=412755 RepID=X0VTJ2_9ZZZZ